MNEPFSTDINYDYHVNKQDSQTSLISTITGGVTATVVDAAASLWNGLPFTPEVDTRELLGKISENALNVYDEHPETIQTASFIAGSFVPAGIAMKGMKLLRSGSQAVNWFSEAGKVADLAKIKSALELGPSGTAIARSATRSMFAKGAANQVLDAAVIETAVIIGMNDSPLMEDYMKDPVKNFAISVGLGGVLGGGIGLIADRFAVSSLAGKVSEEALTAIQSRIVNAPVNATNTVAIQSLSRNVDNLESMISLGKAAGKTPETDLGMSYAFQRMKIEEVALENKFNDMLAPDLLASLDTASKEQLKKILTSNDGMIGVQKVESINLATLEQKGMAKAPKLELGEVPTLSTTTEGKFGPAKPKEVKAIYFPAFNGFGTEADLVHYATAAAKGETSEQMAKSLGKFWGQVPDHDTLLSLQAKSSATAQADYVAAITKVNSMGAKEFNALKVSPTDNATLQAVAARMASDPEFATIGVRLADTAEYGKAIIREKKLEFKYDFASTGKIDTYSPLKNPNTSEDARSALVGWIGANGMQDLRLGAAEYTRAGFTASRSGQTEVQAALEKSFRELKESPGSIALRNAFKEESTDGYVYLWRGSRSDKDRTALRSYSTEESKASEFGSAKLYKVDIDDIVAGFSDIAGKGGINKPEIIVLEGQRIPAVLSKEGKLALAGTVSPTTKTAGLEEIQNLIIANKKTEIDSLISNGIPFESISIKTNTPAELIEQYAGGVGFDTLVAEYKAAQKSLSIVKDTESVKEVMSPLNIPLKLSGNARKQSYGAESVAANNTRDMKEMNALITTSEIQRSDNTVVREFGDFLFTGSKEGGNRGMLDVLENNLGKVNNELSGNFFINSADSAMRKMGEVGPIVSYIGNGVRSYANKIIEQVNKPLLETFSPVSRSIEEVIEWNTAKELNASLSGWREFKDGKFYQYKTDSAGKAMFDAEGNAIKEAVLFQGKEYQVISENVIKSLNKMQELSPILRDLSNVSRRIRGDVDINDIGFWAPSLNPVNKFISYTHNSATGETRMLVASTLEESKQQVAQYRILLAEQGLDKQIQVYQKGAEQEAWSMMNSRLDVMTMKRADTSMQKGGSASLELVKAGTQGFEDMQEGYAHYINAQMRNIADLSMHDITHQLDNMSAMNRYGFDSQPLTGVKKAIEKPDDAAAKVKNLLLGNSNLGEYSTWRDVNSTFEIGLSMGVKAASDVWAAAIAPVTKTFLGGRKALTSESVKDLDYKTIYENLQKKGIVNPWGETFDKAAAEKFGLASLQDSPDTSKRLVFASNSLAATVMLRIGELAQPLVNILSLPVLTSLAAANKMPATFMGIAKQTANTNPVQVMFEGARASFDANFKHWGTAWEKAGYLTPQVSEATEALMFSRSLKPGLIESAEKLVDSSVVKILSKPADWSEAFVRRQTMYTGAMLAKRLYPELDDAGLTIFARDFMDKALGNYNAAQRPVFFQGTMGVALGLFQTYSLTLGQNIYRQLELKNYKALGTAALAQASMFGAGSMPGFGAVSHMIGTHFSDSNIDLTTGTYRALGDNVAETVLYGLPSLSGIGTHTRGDANFRIPGLSGDNVVAINMAKQAAIAIGNVANSVGNGSSAGQAFLEALSLQSMSRPLARGAELASGYSITKAGNTVQTPAEVYSTSGILARVLGTRPTTEIKLREADVLNNYYGALDRDNRNNLMKEIRTSIRDSNFDSGKMSDYAERYFRNGGTPTGWNHSINKALATTETAGKEIFIEKLKPNSALNYMINNHIN